MVKGSHWGHTKVNLENQSRSERRKELQELGKRENNFNKLVDKLRQNARRETGKDTKENG
jgi:hypothetical protein